MYERLADLVVLVHLSFVLFAAFGALLAFRWRWIPWIHLPAVAWGAWIELTDGLCPLTPLENALHRAAGTTGYDGDFVERYVTRVVYPAGLTRDVQLVLAAGLIVVNAVVYAVVWRQSARRAGS